jgi:hypothetical protein
MHSHRLSGLWAWSIADAKVLNFQAGSSRDFVAGLRAATADDVNNRSQGDHSDEDHRADAYVSVA